MSIRYVSFDVYDTLIKRILSPFTMYKLMESKLETDACQYGRDFAKRRMEAETELKKRHQNKNYTLEDIYNTDVFADIGEAEKEKLLTLEIEYEIHNTVPSYYGKELYEKYYKKYPVICISDMYFNRSVIEEILEKNGYHDIKAIYVSCEYKKSKRDRGLYHIVLDDMRINKENLLHIGDAKRSDYFVPKMLGIKSRLVRRVDELIKTDNYYYDFGFNILGPVIYEFCLWIHENSHNRKLLFVSREGEFLKEVYDILFSDMSEMLYISRIALVRGTAYILIQSEGIKNFLSIITRIGLERKVTIEKLFQKLGIKTEKYEKQMKEMHLSCESMISRKNGGKAEVDDLCLSFMENIKLDLLEELENNNIIFDQYINSKLNNSNILVDIGWRGTMQNLLEKYTAAKDYPIELRGLYLGIIKSENNKNCNGFLFEEENDISRSVFNFSGLLEILMMPEYGSVLEYSFSDNKSQVLPILAKSEFDKESYMKIQSVQEGVKELVKLLKVYEKHSCFHQKAVIGKLVKAGSSPGREVIDNFSLLRFYDSGESVPLVGDFTIANIRNLKFLKKAFQDCKWKSAFFRKVFKIKLPYNAMLNWGRKIWN